LNEGFETTRPVDLRDDGVDIDLMSRVEIDGTLKYLKSRKAAGADSIAAELLKNKLSYDKQPAKCTTKKHNYSHMPMI
jgi:hypothetical protein